jgi:hypothetical protein
MRNKRPVCVYGLSHGATKDVCRKKNISRTGGKPKICCIELFTHTYIELRYLFVLFWVRCPTDSYAKSRKLVLISLSRYHQVGGHVGCLMQEMWRVIMLFRRSCGVSIPLRLKKPCTSIILFVVLRLLLRFEYLHPDMLYEQQWRFFFDHERPCLPKGRLGIIHNYPPPANLHLGSIHPSCKPPILH